jgi:hypothetical protein
MDLAKKFISIPPSQHPPLPAHNGPSQVVNQDKDKVGGFFWGAGEYNWQEKKKEKVSY